MSTSALTGVPVPEQVPVPDAVSQEPGIATEDAERSADYLSPGRIWSSTHNPNDSPPYEPSSSSFEAYFPSSGQSPPYEPTSPPSYTSYVPTSILQHSSPAALNLESILSRPPSYQSPVQSISLIQVDNLHDLYLFLEIIAFLSYVVI